MRSICFFASYFTSPQLPYYVEVYLKELKKHFDEVVLICSQNELSVGSRNFLEINHIQLQIEKNEGFDFGLWYKAFQKYDVTAVDEIALVNDSCILFKPLNNVMDWARADGSDMRGITRSEAIFPHLQSYFLILNKGAIRHTADYFKMHGLQKTMRDVIHTYEVGLSCYLIKKGLTIAAFVDNNGYKGEFSPYYQCIRYHLKEGIPLIKKKILFSSYREDELLTLARMKFIIDPEFYIQLIKQYNSTLIIDFEKLRFDKTGEISSLLKLKFYITRSLVTIKKVFTKPRRPLE